MLAGDPTAEQIFFAIPLDATYPSGASSGIQPSDHDGLLPPPAGAPNVFAIYDSDEFGAGDEVHLFDFHADFATPLNSTFTERAESPLTVPAFDDNGPPTRAAIEQPAPGEGLDGIADRLMHRLSYRNLNGTESLVTNHTVNVSGTAVTDASDYQAASRYYEFRKASPGGAYAVYDAATFAPDAGNGATGINRWMGSTAIDGQGNLAMGYSSSSTTLFPSITFVGRNFNQLGASLTNEVTLFSGLGTQAAGSGNRWGDYTSMSVDPVDDCTFWYANEYDPAGDTGFNWRTRIGNFKFAACTQPAQGTLSGTITACDSGAAIGEVLISVTGGPSEGFSAATADDGTYALHLAPGTYNVVASSGIRNCLASASTTVTITDDTTTDFTTCLEGSPKVIFPEGDLSPVTIGDKDGSGIDRNECNSLTVAVQNAGCATALGVVGTLTTTTPGVIITQPTSPFPDLAIGDVATSSPFEVSTTGSFACGTPIDFTLTTTYAGGSDVLTFSVPTCQVPPQAFSGTIQAGDLQTVNGRIGRNGVPSTCDGKPCPGAFGSGPRSYDTYTFMNTSGVPSCATVNLSSDCGLTLIAAAYLGSFDPTNLCTNYVGDAGFSGTAQQFDVTVPPLSTLVVVVYEVSAGTTCAYTGTVSGLIGDISGEGTCPSRLTTRVNDPEITLGEETFDIATLITGTGFTPFGDLTYELFGPDDANCEAAPIFRSIQSVNGNNVYSSTPFTPTATGTYRWVVSYNGDKGNPPVSTSCNDPNENVVVSAVPTPSPSPTPAPQSNDLCSGAIPIACGQTISGNTTLATIDVVPTCGTTLSTAPGIWYTFTGDGLVNTLSTCGFVGYDTKIGVFTGSCGEFTCVTGVDDSCGFQSQVTFQTIQGERYFVLVTGFSTATGPFTLTRTCVPPPAQLINLSTRMRILTGDAVGIGGFIITGEVPKRVIIRAIGPSLSRFGLLGFLLDPVLTLHSSSAAMEPNGFPLTNDNWQDTDRAAIAATGIPPINDLESAIVADLPPGAYTAVVSGKNNTIGLGLVEVYDLDPSSASQLVNISTRAFGDTGSNLMIAGFILGNNTGNDDIVVRGLGPTLTESGVANTLANPSIELRNGDGALLASNNDWEDVDAQATVISGVGLAPHNSTEAAIYASLPPGLYTVLLTDQNGGVGNGLVEVYQIGLPDGGGERAPANK